MTAEPSDEELLRLALGGGEEAFIALYRRFRQHVHRFALAMSGSSSIADDVTQDTFVVLLAEGRRYDPARGPLRAYLRGIARHQLRRRWRRERRYVALADLGGRFAGEEELLRGLARECSAGAIRRAVASLPAHYREAVVLCDLMGMEYAEAAAELRLPIGTIRSRVARARGLLARKLAPKAGARGWRGLLWGWSL